MLSYFSEQDQALSCLAHLEKANVCTAIVSRIQGTKQPVVKITDINLKKLVM